MSHTSESLGADEKTPNRHESWPERGEAGMIVAGVDGCRAGWVVALEQPLRFLICADWNEVAEHIQHCARVAVDMPIGLPEPGQGRECDRLARLKLGPRRNSVFSAPARRYLQAREFSEVSGISLQSFHLLPKIRQLDEWIQPRHESRVWEAHPELIFARLAGGPLIESKKTLAGRQQRLALLGNPLLPANLKRREVAPDDLLDAAALLYCARQPVGRLGGVQRDGRGLVMQIRY